MRLRPVERVVSWIGRTNAGFVILVLTIASVTGSVLLCEIAYRLADLDVAWTAPGGPTAILMPILAPLVLAPLVAFPILWAVRHNIRLVAEISQVQARLEAEVQMRRGLQQALEEQAVRDALTGLLNRRGFFAAVAVYDGPPATVLVVDVDGLKPVNDSFGHASGDALLKAVANSMVATLGQDAVVARLGGDEFVALVPGEDVLEGRVQAAMAQIDLALPAAPAAKVSASVGTARFTRGDAIDAVLGIADARMYAHKRRYSRSAT